MATYALWFGDVHVLVAKLKPPTCFCIQCLSSSPPCKLWTSAHLQHFCYLLSAHDKDTFHVMQYSIWWRYVVIWSTCLHKIQKCVILHNAEGSHVFSNPSYYLSIIRGNMWTLGSRTLWYDAHRIWVLVCCLTEYVTVSFLIHSKAAVINPSVKLIKQEDLVSTTWATSICFTLLATFIVDSLRQNFACCLKLLVDIKSDIFKYCQTCHPFLPFPLHCLAIPVNMWMHQPWA